MDEGFAGRLDRYDDGMLVGSAWEVHDPSTPVEIELFIDGAAGGRFIADIFRPDLRDAGIGDGRHGFAIPICHHAGDGARMADLRFPGGASLPGSPIDLG